MIKQVITNSTSLNRLKKDFTAKLQDIQSIINAMDLQKKTQNKSLGSDGFRFP